MNQNKKKIAVLALGLIVVGLIAAAFGAMLGGHTNITVNMFGRDFYLRPLGIYGSVRTPSAPSAPDRPQPAAAALPDLPEVPETPAITIVGDGALESYASDFALDAFDRIDVDVSFASVSILRGKDFGIELHWNESGVPMEYTLKNGTLRVSDAGGSRNLIQNARGGRVTVYLPIDWWFLEDVRIRAAFGSVSLTDVAANTLDIEADFGEVTLEDCSFERGEISNAFGSTAGTGLASRGLKLENDFGTVTLSGNFTGYLDVDSDMGEVIIRLDGPRSDYSYDVEADFGTIFIDGERFTNSAAGGRGTHRLSIDCDSGNVTVEFNG